MRNKYFICAALAALVTVPIAVSATAVQRSDQRASWRDVASDRDRARIRSWRTAWLEGLRKARGKHGAEVEGAGVLVDPDAALLNPEPPVGEYRCRTIKIGSQGSAVFDWIAYPEFRCRIGRSGGALSFTRLGGSQRPVGRIYADGVRRMIFLGSLQLGDERQVLPYGTDMDRDMAGILERIGDRRWRLVFPRPTFESTIDVVELIPAS